MPKTFPQPGEFGLSRIAGFTGFEVGLGQYLVGDGSRYTHAFVVVPGGKVVEAEPGGARYGDLQEYIERGAVFSGKHVPLTDTQREKIVAEAVARIGTPYSYLDYAALAAHRFGLKIPAVEDYIASEDHMICSQLVDWCYREAGVHLFADNRLPQNVTPGDLANVLIEEW